MSHVAFRPRGERFELDTDYVVVGSGAGGGAVASGLARGGAKVAVVEAGPWRDPTDYPNSMYGTFRDMMDDFGTMVTRGRAIWPVVQGRVVGGTTVINSAIIVRTPGDVFKMWQDDLGFGGDALAEAVWAHQDALDEEIVVTTVPREIEGLHNQLARKGAQAVGIHDHDMRRSVKDCLGSGRCLQGCKSERKQSTNLFMIPEVLVRGGDVLSNAPVKKVVFEGRKAIGVEGRFIHPVTRKAGAKFFVRARKAVVMAASATYSPAILLRSGVKSKALGEGFMAHPGTGVFGCYEQTVQMDVGATQGWSSMKLRESRGFKLETLSLPFELLSSRLAGGGRQLIERALAYPHITLWVMAVRAEARGRVRAGFGGKPVVSYTFTKRDMMRAREAMHLIARMHFEAGAKSVIPAIYGLPYSLGPDQVDLIKEASLDPRAWVLILSHLFGGCGMGADPARSVCDPQGRVHGYENLVVADAAAIPTTIGVNPQLTIMALARLRADELLARG